MKTLLISYGPHFIPLARMLKSDELRIVALHPGMAKMLSDAEIKCESLIGTATSAMQERSLEQAAHTLRVIMDTHVYPQLSEPVIQYVEQHKAGFLYARLADLCLVIECINNLNPDVCITHNDVEPLTRAMAWWSRANRKPCVHVPHAIYLDNKDRLGPDVHDLVTAEYVTAASQYQAKWFLEREPQAKVAITGLPQHDKWCNMKFDRERSCQLLGLNPNRPVVTYASSWRQDTNLGGCHDGIENTYINFLESMKKLSDVQIIVKLHPSGQNQEFHVLAAKKAGVKCIVTVPHLEQVLQASDVVLSLGPSNLILEAAHIPWTRLCVTDGFYNDPQVVKMNPETDDFADVISGMLAIQPLDKHMFLDKYLGIRDGRASERIAGLVKELLWPTPQPSMSKSMPSK